MSIIKEKEKDFYVKNLETFKNLYLSGLQRHLHPEACL